MRLKYIVVLSLFFLSSCSYLHKKETLFEDNLKLDVSLNTEIGVDNNTAENKLYLKINDVFNRLFISWIDYTNVSDYRINITPAVKKVKLRKVLKTSEGKLYNYKVYLDLRTIAEYFKKHGFSEYKRKVLIHLNESRYIDELEKEYMLDKYYILVSTDYSSDFDYTADIKITTDAVITDYKKVFYSRITGEMVDNLSSKKITDIKIIGVSDSSLDEAVSKSFDIFADSVDSYFSGIREKFLTIKFSNINSLSDIEKLTELFSKMKLNYYVSSFNEDELEIKVRTGDKFNLQEFISNMLRYDIIKISVNTLIENKNFVEFSIGKNLI